MLSQGTSSSAVRVTYHELSRLPLERLARLLLERAAEDPMLLSRLHATIEDHDQASRLRPLPSSTEPPRLIGNSAAMRQITDLLTRFVRTEEPVLVTGESGTGKELLARAIHEGSPRRGGPFVAVNCAAIPSSLVASELFGYEKGAFTGAAARTRGQIEHANKGTLFLDEIGDMPIDLQGHLLRFLQEGQIVRVGGRDPIDLDVRVVSATNVRLRQAIADGRFREDLFYRLNVLTLHMPPLRDRPEDVEPLARHFLQAAARDFRRPVAGFEPAALDALCRYQWPGNVRELMSVVRRAVVIGEGDMVIVADLMGLTDSAGLDSPTPPARTLPRPGSQEERSTLLDALSRTRENITMAARELGVSRVTLYRMLRRHAIRLSRGMNEPPVAHGALAERG